jgi:hypothetical protein
VIHKSEGTLKSFRGPGICGLCGRWLNSRHVHHVIAKGGGGGRRLDVPFNLIPVGGAFDCPCHADADAHRISISEVFAKVGEREGMDGEEVERRVRLMLRAPKDCRVCLACEGLGRWVCTLGRTRWCGNCEGVGILNHFGEPWHEDGEPSTSPRPGKADRTSGRPAIRADKRDALPAGREREDIQADESGWQDF